MAEVLARKTRSWAHADPATHSRGAYRILGDMHYRCSSHPCCCRTALCRRHPPHLCRYRRVRRPSHSSRYHKGRSRTSRTKALAFLARNRVVVTITYHGSPTEFIIVGLIAILVSPILGRLNARMSYRISKVIRRKSADSRPAMNSKRYTFGYMFVGIVFVVLGIYRTLR